MGRSEKIAELLKVSFVLFKAKKCIVFYDIMSSAVKFIRDRYDLEYLFMSELKKDGDLQFDDQELSNYGFKQLRHRRKRLNECKLTRSRDWHWRCFFFSYH